MEEPRLVLYVDRERDEVFVNFRRDLLVSVGFGLQPNAAPSAGSRAEIE